MLVSQPVSDTNSFDNMSPRQRASNKKLVTNWFTTAEIEALKELAAARGLDVTALFRQFIHDECKNHGIKIDEQKTDN